MPKVKISEFDTVAANNTDIDGINLGEGMLPSDVNNAIRELMSQLKDFQTGAASDSFGGPIAPTSPSTIVVNSSSDALRITQTGAGNALLVEDETNPDSTPFVIGPDGRVTIGHTTAITYAASLNPNFQLNVAGAGQIGISRFSANTASNALVFLKSRGATIADYTTVASGDGLGSVNFYGADGTSGILAAQILSSVDGTPGTNDMPGRLVFSTTADGSATPSERMRINNAGEIGIGGSPNSGRTLDIKKVITGGTTGRAVRAEGQIQSDVTGTASYFSSSAAVANATFTLTTLAHFSATQGTIGASATVTNQYGFEVLSSLTGATNNYGFYSDIPTATGRWNFYANGTAENYLGGNLKVGSTAARGTTAGTNHLSIFDGTAPAGTLTNGITLYSASGDLNFMDSSGNGYQVGYRNIPQNSKSAAYTLVLGDSGEHIFHPSADTTARTWTIPANSSVAFPIGTAVTFINQNGAGVVTIAITTDTMRLAGAGTTGSRTLAANGIATAIKVTSTEWIISGTGLT
jgi:hypothetical protein